MTTESNKYIINIMAHNEEETIEQTINAVFSQEIDKNYEIEIHIFANACTDNTENIIEEIAKKKNNVKLHSIPKKGKVNALRECISYFKNEGRLDVAKSQGKLFFMDADITIPRKDVLVRLDNKLESTNKLYLVSALPVPESCYNQSRDFVSELFRIRYHLQFSFKKNLVRGACHIVRWAALQQIVFPEGLVSTDMFLEVKLDGHFLMEHNIQVVTKLKKTLKLEIKRDLLHQIGREQVYYWRRQGLTPRLDRETAVKEYFLSPLDPKEYFSYLIQKRKIRSLMILCSWMFIYKYNSHRARKIFLQSLEKNMNLLDYWSTKR